MDGWYSEGTEIVFACGGGIYTSALAAALNYDAKVIGVDVDQHYIGENKDICPDYNPFVTSAMKGLQNVTETILDELNKGNWDNYSGKFVNYSLAEGEYVGIPTEEASWGFTTFTVEEYETVKAAIKDGSVSVDNNSSEADVSKYDFSNVNVKYVA